MIKGCLFDLDGTLLNTLTTIRYYLNETLEKFGYKTISEEQTKKFVGHGAKNLIETTLNAVGADLSKEENKPLFNNVYDDYIERYNADSAYLTEAYDGIKELIDVMKNRGLKLAVISNKPDTNVKELIDINFPNTFDIVEGATDRMPLKPVADWPRDILKRLSLDPSEVIYVGDTSTDMQTAKNFGAAVAVGVLWGFREKDELLLNGADVIVSHPLEIAKLLDR